ncbi:MAG TPA: hypothetical protein VGK81_11790, partial [Anaerolineae bacterium]
ALTVEDGRVLVASAPARASGVIGGMPLRQALARCPDLVTRELDMRSCQAEHAALLSTLAQTGLPVEATNWGSAYVDLREVTRDLPDAQSLIADLGRQVRHALGDALQPALGWDTGKFTARAASLRSKPGQMRLVSQPDETRFLTPLPVTLLPLPPITLQQLDWLGIHTLGTFARLPVAAVQQRFGVQGKLAQQLAQGRDDRPVAQTINAKPEPIDIDLEAPTTSQDVVLGAAMHALEPHLQALAQRLEGCRQLRAELRFIDGSRRTFTHIFVEPVCASAFIREMLSQELQRLTWPGELVALQLMLLDVSELTPTQLSLFPELDQNTAKRAPFTELVSKLAPRYGAIFWRAQMSDGQHPLPERRFCFLQEGGHHDAPVARQRNH